MAEFARASRREPLAVRYYAMTRVVRPKLEPGKCRTRDYEPSALRSHSAQPESTIPSSAAALSMVVGLTFATTTVGNYRRRKPKPDKYRFGIIPYSVTGYRVSGVMSIVS